MSLVQRLKMRAQLRVTDVALRVATRVVAPELGATPEATALARKTVDAVAAFPLKEARRALPTLTTAGDLAAYAHTLLTRIDAKYAAASPAQLRTRSIEMISVAYLTTIDKRTSGELRAIGMNDAQIAALRRGPPAHDADKTLGVHVDSRLAVLAERAERAGLTLPLSEQAADIAVQQLRRPMSAGLDLAEDMLATLQAEAPAASRIIARYFAADMTTGAGVANLATTVLGAFGGVLTGRTRADLKALRSSGATYVIDLVLDPKLTLQAAVTDLADSNDLVGAVLDTAAQGLVRRNA